MLFSFSEARARRHTSFKQMLLQGERGLSQYPFWDSVSCNPSSPHICYVAKSDLEFLIFLPPLPECWDYSMQGFIWLMCCCGWIPGFYACKANTPLTGPHPQLLLMEDLLFWPSESKTHHTLLSSRLEKLSYPDPRSSPFKSGECPPTSWEDYLGTPLKPSTSWHVGTVLVVSVKAYLRLLHAEAEPLFGGVPLLLI